MSFYVPSIIFSHFPSYPFSHPLNPSSLFYICYRYFLWPSQNVVNNFVVNRFFMKLFKTTDMQVVTMSREHFDFVLPSLQLDRRRRSFVGSAVATDLIFINLT